MRAAIYARVSSKAQREKHTIDGQLRVLRAYVEAQGWMLVETYLDDGRSAKTGQGLDDRAGFRALVAAAGRKVFDVVLVVAIDRLTRTEDLLEQAEILAPFQRAGVQIVTPASGALDLRTMFGRLWTVMQAFVGAEENRVRGERIRQGKARAISHNRKPAGPTPFGLLYDRATGTWAIDAPAAELVRELVRRVAAGESCAAVADDFARRNERAPGRGKAWTRATAYRIVHNGYSCGEWTVNKAIGAIVKVPRIVDDETWQAAQAQLRKSQRTGLLEARTQHVYLLQGIATCGHCGAPIVIRSGVKYFNAVHEPREHPAAYMCKGRMKPRTCDAPIAHVRELDERVWAAVAERLDHPRLVRELAEVETERAADARDWSADVVTHAQHLARLERVETEIMARFRRGMISPGALDKELEALGRERKAVRDQLATAERAVGANESARVRLAAASATVERLRGALPKASPEQRRALLRELVGPGGAQIRDRQVHLELRVIRPVARTSSRTGPIGVVTASD